MEQQIAASAYVSEAIDESLISLPALRRLGWAVFARSHDTPVLVAPSPKDGPAEANGHVLPLSEDELSHFSHFFDQHAQRTRTNFNPQHWLLCHMGLY